MEWVAYVIGFVAGFFAGRLWAPSPVKERRFYPYGHVDSK